MLRARVFAGERGGGRGGLAWPCIAVDRAVSGVDVVEPASLYIFEQ